MKDDLILQRNTKDILFYVKQLAQGQKKKKSVTWQFRSGLSAATAGSFVYSLDSGQYIFQSNYLVKKVCLAGRLSSAAQQTLLMDYGQVQINLNNSPINNKPAGDIAYIDAAQDSNSLVAHFSNSLEPVEFDNAYISKGVQVDIQAVCWMATAIPAAYNYQIYVTCELEEID